MEERAREGEEKGGNEVRKTTGEEGKGKDGNKWIKRKINRNPACPTQTKFLCTYSVGYGGVV